MQLGLLPGAVLTENLPEYLSIIHLAQRVHMHGEGERVDLRMFVSIVVVFGAGGWGKRDLPRRPAPPRFRGEMSHSLPWRNLCGLVFRLVWETVKVKLWSILAGHCERRS